MKNNCLKTKVRKRTVLERNNLTKDNTWTHQQNGRQRVIDYFLVEPRFGRSVTDAGVTGLLDLGSDHRTIQLVMDVLAKTRTRRGKFRATLGKSTVGWRPTSTSEYQRTLDLCLQDSVVENRLYWTSRSIEDKLSFLEKQTVQTAKECRRVQQRNENGKHATSDVLKGLVEHRRNLRVRQQRRKALFR